MNATSRIRIVDARQIDVPSMAAVMSEGRPWLPEGSDYWFFTAFHGSTSFVAFKGELIAGGLIGCRNAERPDEIYIDQVAVHRAARGQGIVQALFGAVEQRARDLRCTRIWLSTDPKNPAVQVWPRLGFVNCPGDMVEAGVAIRRDFKGPGKHRAIFEKVLR